MANDETMPPISRRSLIASAALVPVTSIQSAAQPATQVFSPEQRRLIEAFVGRLIPKDETGPGAVECGVPDYIEGSFGDALAAEKPIFLEGLAAVDAFARASHQNSFAELPPETQDALLTAMQNNSATGFPTGSAAFFERFRRLTLEGMFGDPYYGGNRHFAGWDLIRYPGVRLAVAPDEQKMGKIEPLRVSAWGVKYGH